MKTHECNQEGLHYETPFKRTKRLEAFQLLFSLLERKNSAAVNFKQKRFEIAYNKRLNFSAGSFCG